MKFFLFFVWCYIVNVCESACDPHEDRHFNHQWMTDIAGIQGKKLSEILLMGSHDAGTAYSAFHSKTMFARLLFLYNAVTQSYSLEDQLCHGTRVFDIRFAKTLEWEPYSRTPGVDASDRDIYHKEKFRIFHGIGGSNFLFETLGEIADQVYSFCSSHPTEVAILRIKFESENNAENQDVMETFAKALKGCAIVPPNPIMPQATPLLSDFSIKQLLALPRVNPQALVPGGVILMHYNVDPVPVPVNSVPASRTTAVAWSYMFNLGGKSKEKSSFKAHVPLQLRFLDNWQRNRDEVAPFGCAVELVDGEEKANCHTPLFGFWFTLTFKMGGNVLGETLPKIKDDGKYGGWLQQIIFSRLNTAAKAGGVVIWTDFCGVDQASIAYTARQVNANIGTPPVGLFTTGIVVPDVVPAGFFTRAQNLPIPGLANIVPPRAGLVNVAINNPLNGVPAEAINNAIAPVHGFKSKTGAMKHKHLKSQSTKMNKKKKISLRKKSETQNTVKATWPFPLSFCEGSGDDEAQFSEDKTFEEQSSSACLSDHIFAVDDDFDFCDRDVYPTTQELAIMCQGCESGIPFIDWLKSQSPCPGFDLTPYKNLPCCSYIEAELLENEPVIVGGVKN